MPITEATIPVYKTSDGATFTNKSEAIAHQTSLDIAKDVANYVASLGYKDRHKSTLITAIINWEIAKAQRTETAVPAPEKEGKKK